MTKVIGLLGSPRRGRNTETLLDACLAGASKQGAVVEKISITDLNIKPCASCYGCARAGECVIKQDGFGLVDEALAAADLIVLASPLYFGGVSAQLKALIDRAQVYWSRQNELKLPSLLPEKRRFGLFLCTGGAPNKLGNNFLPATTTAKLWFQALQVEYRGQLIAENTDRVPVADRVDLLQEASKLGQQLSAGDPDLMSILSLLLAAYPQAVSGEAMATALSISRSAIWKRIQGLQGLGLKISGRQNSGYQLDEWPDCLLPELLEHYRKTSELGKYVHYLASVDSTNTRAKLLADAGAAHGTLVVAEEQTAGRGRRGRSWESEARAGICASLVLRPSLPPERVALLTLAVGVAVVEALEQFGLIDAWVKWPNDVWAGRRKLVGILAELSGQVDEVDWVVVGIGINVHQLQWPPELVDRATSFLQETGIKLNRAELLAAVLLNLEQLLPLLQQPTLNQLFARWRSHDRLIGQQVTVVAPSESFSGTAIDLTESGALLVRRTNGQEQAVLAGDVSLRI